MARNYSKKWKETTARTGADEAPLLLLEITHADLAEPVRVVNDTDDFPYGVAKLWKPAIAYAVNDIVIPNAYNGRYYKCTVAGTSGATEPTWPTTLTQTVADGTATWRCEGNQFRAFAFRAALPDEQDQQLPRAKLAVDNVGRELMQWLESSGGGEGAQCRMMQALRSDPGTIEWDITLDLTNLKATMAEVTGDLGFEDLLNRPGIPFTYRPDTAPGLF